MNIIENFICDSLTLKIVSIIMLILLILLVFIMVDISISYFNQDIINLDKVEILDKYISGSPIKTHVHYMILIEFEDKKIEVEVNEYKDFDQMKVGEKYNIKLYKANGIIGEYYYCDLEG